MTELKEIADANHARVLEVISASSTNSAELQAKLDDLRSLVIPYLQIRSEFGMSQASLSSEIREAHRISRDTIQDSLKAMQRTFEKRISDVAPTTASDQPTIQQHISKLERPQTCICEERTALTDMITEVREILSKLKPQDNSGAKELTSGNEKLQTPVASDSNESCTVLEREAPNAVLRSTASMEASQANEPTTWPWSLFSPSFLETYLTDLSIESLLALLRHCINRLL